MRKPIYKRERPPLPEAPGPRVEAHHRKHFAELYKCVVADDWQGVRSVIEHWFGQPDPWAPPRNADAPALNLHHFSRCVAARDYEGAKLAVIRAFWHGLVLKFLGMKCHAENPIEFFTAKLVMQDPSFLDDRSRLTKVVAAAGAKAHDARRWQNPKVLARDFPFQRIDARGRPRRFEPLDDLIGAFGMLVELQTGAERPASYAEIQKSLRNPLVKLGPGRVRQIVWRVKKAIKQPERSQSYFFSSTVAAVLGDELARIDSQTKFRQSKIG